MPSKAKAQAKERVTRSYDEKMAIVQRALNRKETGETIKQISEDTGASEAIIYLLLKRHNDGLPLDLRESHQPSLPLPLPPPVERHHPINKSDAEQRALADLLKQQPRTGSHPSVVSRSFSTEVNFSSSARAKEERVDIAAYRELEAEMSYLRRRVVQLENVVRAFLEV